MLDLELCAKFSDQDIVEVGTIISDDPLKDAISTYKVMFYELGYNILGNWGK